MNLLIAYWTSEQTTVLAVFAFAIGCALGSFLNVVVYRSAAGMSLLRPASRCPQCQTPIKARDNLPVLGWLLLGGKCRACGQRISPRYPLVEFTMGLVCFSIVWLGPLAEGGYLPRPRPSDMELMDDWATPAIDLRFDQPRLWGMAAWHVLLLGWLLCRALWERDGRLPPRRFQRLLVVTGLLLPIFFFWFHPVPVSLGMARWVGVQRWAVGLANSGIGLIVGTVLGMLAAPATGDGRWGEAGRAATIGSLAVIGLVLGWQAVCGIGVVVALAGWLIAMFRPASKWVAAIDYGDCLFLATWGWLLLWNRIAVKMPRFAYAGDFASLGVSGLVVLILSVAAMAFGGRRKTVRSAGTHHRQEPPKNA